ncbi:MAG TPA: hypothetical protein VE779_06185 [Candidatus Angelobacter sp.]|nr:hypothetical protein [Candidatus Angelobacter sp.]
MPVAVTSAVQSPPEFMGANFVSRTGDDFRESMQQAAQGISTAPGVSSAGRNKKADDGDTPSEQTQEEHKKTLADQSTTAAQGCITVPATTTAMVAELPRVGGRRDLVQGDEMVAGKTAPLTETLSSAQGRIDSGGSGQAMDRPPGVAAPSMLGGAVAGTSSAELSSATSAKATSTSHRPATGGASGETDSGPDGQIQSALAKDSPLAESATAKMTQPSTSAMARASDPAVATQLARPADGDAAATNSEAADASETVESHSIKAIRQPVEGVSSLGAAGYPEQVKQAGGMMRAKFPADGKADPQPQALAAQETASADGSTKAHQNLDGCLSSHASPDDDKTRDRADASVASTNRASSESAGALHGRAGESAGHSSGDHLALSPEMHGVANGAGRAGSSGKATSDFSSQAAGTAAGRDTDDPQLTDNLTMPVTVNAAHLAERMKESEINLSVRSVDFGNVAIHTAMSHERLSAQISLEHNELGKAIAGDVPALQSKLSQEHGIQASIEVQAQGQSFSGSGGQQQQQSWRPQNGGTAMAQQDNHDSAVALPVMVADGRLDIRV